MVCDAVFDGGDGLRFWGVGGYSDEADDGEIGVWMEEPGFGVGEGGEERVDDGAEGWAWELVDGQPLAEEAVGGEGGFDSLEVFEAVE